MNDNPEYVKIAFKIQAQNYTNGRFSIPNRVRDDLGLESEDLVHVKIENESGETLTLDKHLKSGQEIYGSKIRSFVKAGEPIIVSVSRA